MAIEHSLLLKGEDVTIDQFADYCCGKGINFTQLNEISIYIDAWEMTIYFLNCKNKPYNTWESELYKGEFVYDACISFRLGKNPDVRDEQTSFVINYIFELMSKIKQEGLFLYCYDSELCYFKADGSVQVDDKYGVIARFRVL